MQPPSTPSDILAASHDLKAILAEIEALRASLAVSTPERQRLAFTAWIARARAAEAVLGGRWAAEQVGEIARSLHYLSRVWWPGRVAALDPRSTPADAWPGVRLESWCAVATWCSSRLACAESWADDLAREPPPHDAATLFAAACDALRELGGPLGDAPRLDRMPGALATAQQALPRLARIAAELRWLRGTAPAEAWGLAVGRLRGLARALGRDGAPLANNLAPALVPLEGWASSLGRDPARERVLGRIPDAESSNETLIDWLVDAFDVLDTPALASLTPHLRTRLDALRPAFDERRYRRRLDQLLRHLAQQGIPDASAPEIHPHDSQRSEPEKDSRYAELRVQLQGRRALFAGNRAAPEIERFLAEHLGLHCDVVVSAGSPRRRQALVRRILSCAYDIVFVAHGFTGHADTGQLGMACKQAGVLHIAVDKGRPTRLVAALWEYRQHPRLADAVRGSAA